MIPYRVKDIAQAVSGTHSGPGNSLVKTVITDSRSLHSPADSMFVAITGPRHDGHMFIHDLFEKGVRCFMVANSWKPRETYPEADIILVNDTLEALQDFASMHRARFSIPVIGITGSNGKTIIKEWLHQCLLDKWHITRSPKSYNSQLGVPLSILLLDEHSGKGIFEAGISQPGEMERLQQVIRPTIGVFSNVGEAHQENFSSPEQKVREKLNLFVACETLICCKDHKLIWQEVKRNAGFKNILVKTWSALEEADLKIIDVERKASVTSVSAIYQGQHVAVEIPFTDDASFENAMHVWLVMLHLQIDPGEIRKKMAELSPVAMRLEQKSGINNCYLINDCYNADVNSLAIALDVLNRTVQHPKRTLILSDILQSGLKAADLYKRVAELVSEKQVSRIIGIGPALLANKSLFTIPGSFYATTTDFIENIYNHYFANETILLK